LVQHLSVSKFSTGIGLEPDILRLDNAARVQTARTTLLLSQGRTHDIRLGGSVERYEMNYDMRSLALETNAYTLEYRPTVWSAFIDDQWSPFKQLLLRPGARLIHVTGGAEYTAVEPRFGFKAFLTSDLALTGSAGRFHQAVHSIRDQSVPITMFDFWIGADDLTPVARSDHYVLGFEKWLSRTLSLTVEGFEKTYDNLLIQDDRDDPKVRGDEFVRADGYARGVDVLVRKYEGSFTGWIAYGFAKAERNTEEQTFPPAHDRRHTLDIVVQTKGPFGSNMGIRWGFGSALPYTGITGQWLHREYNAELHAFDWYEDEVISNTINGERFPHYSRLDIGFRWEIEKWGGIWRPYFQLVNAYNRTNVWVYSFNYDRAPPTRTGFSQLPILPTIGVEFEF
ncbi:MAG: TonB-dependent receptor, partial [Myxococcota bacterium]|nr:TonB-dependent receptor [Myxococcota bacterium]